MPPKPKITKDMILSTVLAITQEAGFEAVNARSIAHRLSCSTRPLFTCYKNMDELKASFLDFAFAYYTRYVDAYSRSTGVNPAFVFPLSYIAFAKEETHLFRFLFLSDIELDMSEPKDFYKEPGNEEKALAFSQLIGAEPERGKDIFFDLFLYAHGMAVLTASGKLSLSSRHYKNRVQTFLQAYCNLENGKDGNHI